MIDLITVVDGQASMVSTSSYLYEGVVTGLVPVVTNLKLLSFLLVTNKNQFVVSIGKGVIFCHSSYPVTSVNHMHNY